MGEVDPADYPRDAEEWGERVAGVRQRLDTEEPAVALTFDAGGGAGGDGVDTELLAVLADEAVPATLFVNARWIEANPDVFDVLGDAGAGLPAEQVAAQLRTASAGSSRCCT